MAEEEQFPLVDQEIPLDDRELLTDIEWLPEKDMAAVHQAEEAAAAHHAEEAAEAHQAEEAAEAHQAEEAAATGCSSKDTVRRGSKSPIDESEEDADMKKKKYTRLPRDKVLEIFLHKDIQGCCKKELIAKIAAKFDANIRTVLSIRNGLYYSEITRGYLRETTKVVIDGTSKVRSNRSPFVESSTALKYHTKEDALKIYAAKIRVLGQGLVGSSKIKRDREVRKALTKEFDCTPKCISEIWRARHQPEFTEELWEDGMREKAKKAKYRRSRN